jgi:hypothetical protein
LHLGNRCERISNDDHDQAAGSLVAVLAAAIIHHSTDLEISPARRLIISSFCARTNCGIPARARDITWCMVIKHLVLLLAATLSSNVTQMVGQNMCHAGISPLPSSGPPLKKRESVDP